MATLHLMVGLPCSGKTTRARELEKKYSALRFTPDEWHIRLFGHDYGENMTKSEEAAHDIKHDTVEALMWELAEKVLVLDIDVILDFGCWARSQRDAYRARAKDLGAQFRIHFMDASEPLLFERLKERNQQNPEKAFYIPKAKLSEWLKVFEPPSSEELDQS